VCLQEVPEELRAHLETTLGNSYPYTDTALDHFSDGLLGLSLEKKCSYLMILSRVPFVNTVLKYVHRKIGKRTALARIRGWHECLEHHGVDIFVGNMSVRVLNLHIACAATPRNKWRQLRHAMKYHLSHDGETIICGDFNITANPEPKHLPFYCLRRILKPHYSIQELLQERELRIFARIIAKRELHDVCGGHITHPDSGLVLDKILVSNRLREISKPLIFPHTHGSDHFPIGVEINTHT
jgi:endonuclease/exonuclease/phosphatase family metal-dependent hydrolase